MYFTQMAVKTFLVTYSKKHKLQSRILGTVSIHLYCEGGLFIVENVNGAKPRYCQIASFCRPIVIPISLFGIYRLTLFVFNGIAVKEKLTTCRLCGYTKQI
jgi:hypothetical protein